METKMDGALYDVTIVRHTHFSTRAESEAEAIAKAKAFYEMQPDACEVVDYIAKVEYDEAAEADKKSLSHYAFGRNGDEAEPPQPISKDVIYAIGLIEGMIQRLKEQSEGLKEATSRGIEPQKLYLTKQYIEMHKSYFPARWKFRNGKYYMDGYEVVEVGSTKAEGIENVEG